MDLITARDYLSEAHAWTISIEKQGYINETKNKWQDVYIGE